MVDSELLANFCSITDATDTTAEYYLSAAGGDLDMAIGLFYESGVSAGPTTTSTDSSQNIHEISARMSERNTANITSEPPSRPQTIILNDSDSEKEEDRVVVVEGEEEEEVEVEGDVYSRAEDPIFNSQANNYASSSNSTARRLADLFRPPHAIMFNGTFEMARRFAREQNRWLLVTVHAPTDFPSQAMNRDLWNSPLLQSFIKENFVFVQMIVGGSDERRYNSFYPFDGLYPHVALIDPRTGERVETLLVASINVPGFKLVSTDRDMIEILGEFIANNYMDTIGDQRKRSSSSPKLEREEDVEEESKKSAKIQTEQLKSSNIPDIPPCYDGPDSIQIQFRLPSGQKHRHRFNPKESSVSEIFKTASAISQIPIGEFQLRTAEGQLDEIDISKLHNSMLTIIK